MLDFFNVDNGFFSAVGKIFDLMCLSFLWVLFCIPVVTIGPATAALYYTTVKVIRKDRGYVFSEFWHSFKTNFFQGTIFSCVLVVLSFIFYVNFDYVRDLNSKFGTVLYGVYLVMVYVIFACAIYFFPALSRFSMKMKDLVKFSLFVSMKHLPETIILQIIVALVGLSLWCVPITYFIAPALGCLVLSLRMEKVLKVYMPKDETSDPDRKEWYSEL